VKTGRSWREIRFFFAALLLLMFGRGAKRGR
jgi:hypothetical protein